MHAYPIRICDTVDTNTIACINRDLMDTGAGRRGLQHMEKEYSIIR